MTNGLGLRGRIPLFATALAVGVFCVATIQAAFATGDGCTGKATTPNYPAGPWTVECGGTCPTTYFCISIVYPNGDPGNTMEGCYCDPTPGNPGSGDEVSSTNVVCTFQLIRDAGSAPYALCLKELCVENCAVWSGWVAEPPPGHGEQHCVCP